MNPIRALLVVIAASASFDIVAVASVLDLSYVGRMTSVDGSPVAGPVALEVRFYRSAAGDDVIAVPPLAFTDVALDDGVFQIRLAIDAPALHTVFPKAGAPVFVEVRDVTHARTYPRQAFSPVPYALKVPVDGETVDFDEEGRLTVKPQALTQASIPGLTEALAGKVGADANGKVGIGTSAPGHKLHVTGGNLFVDAATGNIVWGTATNPVISLGYVETNLNGNYIKTAGGDNDSLDIGAKRTGSVKFNEVSSATAGNNQEVRFYGYSSKIGDEGSRYGLLKWGDGGTLNSSYLALGTQGANYPLVLQAGGGNVGIGTTTPNLGMPYGPFERQLAVTGRGDAPDSFGRIILGNIQSAPVLSSYVGMIDFVSANNAGAEKRSAIITSVLLGTGGPNGLGGDLRFATKADNGGTAFHMTIDPTGNVGIGTTTPLATAGFRAGLEIASAANVKTPTLMLNSTDATSNNAQVVFAGPSGLNWLLGTDSPGGSGSRDFSIMDPVGGQSAVTIAHATRNVGIGTTAPESTLQVAGYVQLQTVTTPPPASDCDSAAERGRMKIETDAGFLWICADSGWVSK